jgi:threonine/homoserine/homoserine lactone efflux protein
MTFFLWSQFAIVCLLGAMSPGPSLALIIRNSINFNRSSGIIASIAHGLGICLYATVTVIVLEFILRNSEIIFFVIQICGSLFLIILGLIFIFKKNNENQNDTYQIHSSSFAQGFIIAIINPKILIWFTAIYSQFIDINSTFLNKTILVLTPSIIDAIWYSLVSILVTGYGLKEILNNKKFMIQKIIGILLIIIAFSLVYSLISF